MSWNLSTNLYRHIRFTHINRFIKISSLVPLSLVFVKRCSLKHSVLYSALLAMFFFTCATVPNPEDIRKADTHNKIGRSYLNNGQLNEASIEFQKALKLNRNSKEALNYLGYIHARFKKYDNAISYYKRAIAVDPNYSDAMNNLGVVYLDLKNWDKAIKFFDAALKNPIYRTPEKAHLSKGYAYYKKGDYINSENSIREALILNPVFPLAMYTLGLVYIELDKDDDAIKEFKKAIGIMPNYSDAHFELAKIYLRSGKKSKALKHFTEVVESDGNTEKRKEALMYIELLKY